MSRRLVFLAALALLPPSATHLAAQVVTEEFPLTSGQRTRVTYVSRVRPLIGEFVSFDSSELVMRTPADRQSYYITWNNVAHLERSVGQRTRAQTVRRGIASGFLLGVALGVSVVGGNEAMWKYARYYREPARQAAFYGLGITTIGGAILGLDWPTETWQRVSAPGTLIRLTIPPN